MQQLFCRTYNLNLSFFKKKRKKLIYSERDKVKILQSLKFVDEVFVEESLEKKKYIEFYKEDTLAMGDDWKCKFDKMSYVCDRIYITRTPSISTTEIIEITKGI